MEILADFVCQCRGIKFYDLKSVGTRWGDRVRLVKEPTNSHDPLCVAAWVTGTLGAASRTSRTLTPPLMLGHVAREAARWINPLLSVHRLNLTRLVHSIL